jgi:hypothetical protein
VSLALRHGHSVHGVSPCHGSPSRHVFDPGPVHVKFGVDTRIVALEQASLRVIRLSAVTLITFLSEGQGSEA